MQFLKIKYDFLFILLSSSACNLLVFQVMYKEGKNKDNS